MIDNLINWDVIFTTDDSVVSELLMYPIYDEDGYLIHYLSNNPQLAGMTFEYKSNSMLGITTYQIIRIS